ncbi:MAG: DUF2059 domain-containing protein [Erythrobacter sp.]
MMRTTLMKTFGTNLSVGLAALSLAFAGPAVAQDEAEGVVIEDAEVGSDAETDEAAEAMAALAGMFQVEPLTAEQESRLPLATTIIDRMIPPGSLGEMMGSMYDEILAPIMSMASQIKNADIAEPLGLEAYEIDLSQEQLEQAASIIDPVREQRVAAISGVMPEVMQEIMTLMEPGMRKAMSEVYSVHFTDQELADIDIFFSTESGLSFARKSLTMSSDPRVIAASMDIMPALMGSFENMAVRMEEAAADLPEVRGFGDLTAEERAQLSEIIGISEQELAERAAEISQE